MYFELWSASYQLRIFILRSSSMVWSYTVWRSFLVSAYILAYINLEWIPEVHIFFTHDIQSITKFIILGMVQYYPQTQRHQILCTSVLSIMTWSYLTVSLSDPLTASTKALNLIKIIKYKGWFVWSLLRSITCVHSKVQTVFTQVYNPVRMVNTTVVTTGNLWSQKWVRMMVTVFTQVYEPVRMVNTTVVTTEPICI